MPLGVLVAVTGVAGSGKSSLIHGCLPRTDPSVTVIDQSAIRGSRRSNPATYTGILDPIRTAFAKANGVKPALFSANSEGACPNCNGLGKTYTSLGFMAEVVSVCEVCEGRRYTDDVLEYRLRGRNIVEVLAMPVEEARDFFTEKPVRVMLERLADVGPRLHLAGPGARHALRRRAPAPEAGDRDVRRHGGLRPRRADHRPPHAGRRQPRSACWTGWSTSGRTVIVIEHNLDVVARADWVIDLGPGAGHDGGRVIFEGPPAELIRAEDRSPGRKYLRRRLEFHRGGPSAPGGVTEGDRASGVSPCLPPPASRAGLRHACRLAAPALCHVDRVVGSTPRQRDERT